jgi:RIO kinase 1
MSPKHNFDQFDLNEELDEIELDGPTPRVRNRIRDRQRPRLKDRYHIIEEPEVVAAINEQADDRRTLDFTYQASQTEAAWLLESLGGLYENQWIADVLQVVKGGKEASVYMCKGTDLTGEDLIAAKVYRPRMFRALRNDSQYREGRTMLDEDGLVIRREGPLKAIRNRTQLGDRLIHQSWIMHEVEAMKMLDEAGFDVPAVYANGDNAILMEFVGDADGAAPILHDVRLEAAEARNLFERILHNIEGMLRLDLVHGDLSAYNILYYGGEIVLIDFPQVVTPGGNRSAFEIFHRDVTRVCEYFRRQGITSDADLLARKLWGSCGLRSLPEADPALLDPADEGDLGYWEKFGS